MRFIEHDCQQHHYHNCIHIDDNLYYYTEETLPQEFTQFHYCTFELYTVFEISSLSKPSENTKIGFFPYFLCVLLFVGNLLTTSFLTSYFSHSEYEVFHYSQFFFFLFSFLLLNIFFFVMTLFLHDKNCNPWDFLIAKFSFARKFFFFSNRTKRNFCNLLRFEIKKEKKIKRGRKKHFSLLCFTLNTILQSANFRIHSWNVPFICFCFSFLHT